MANGTQRGGLGDVAVQLDALLRMALTARESPVEEVLEAVAETARDILGFSSVVINRYRPAWHDYEAVLVLPGGEVREALLGTTNSYEQIHDLLLREEFERVPNAYFLPAGTAVWEQMENTYASSGEGDPVDDDAWQADDGLLVTLTSTDGAPLGVVSVDDPVGRRRPDDHDLRLLAAVCSHAALAIETSEQRWEVNRHRRALEGILSFATGMSGHTAPEEVLGRACRVAAEVTEFGSVAGFLSADEDDAMERVAGIGRDLGPWPLDAVGLEGEEVEVRILESGRGSPRDGSGPRAWRGHLVAIPLRRSDGALIGGILLGDPEDRLLPDRVRRQEMRLLADQVVAALALVDRERHLADLAIRDPLTGLRNRRGLEERVEDLVAEGRPLAVITCDLDHFKSVNDTYGHETGDRALESFAALLGRYSRGSDLAVRLGGEEFCLLLPDTDLEGARLLGERIRTATPAALAGILPHQTVSVGVAASGDPEVETDGLLARADAALYAAKRGGRDRVAVG